MAKLKPEQKAPEVRTIEVIPNFTEGGLIKGDRYESNMMVNMDGTIAVFAKLGRAESFYKLCKDLEDLFDRFQIMNSDDKVAIERKYKHMNHVIDFSKKKIAA